MNDFIDQKEVASIQPPSKETSSLRERFTELKGRLNDLFRGIKKSAESTMNDAPLISFKEEKAAIIGLEARVKEENDHAESLLENSPAAETPPSETANQVEENEYGPLLEALKEPNTFQESEALAKIALLGQSPDQNVQKNIIGLLESALPIIDQNLGTSAELAHDYFDVFLKFSNGQNPELSALAIDFLSKHSDLLGQKISDQLEGKDYQDYCSFIFQVIGKGNPEQSREASAVMKKVLEEAAGKPDARAISIAQISTALVCDRNESLKSLGEDFIKSRLSGYGLDYDRLRPLWDRSTPDNSEAIAQNFGRIIELERSRPGSSSILSQEFGIADFGRYPLNMLTRQYDQRDNTDIPYGIAIYPRDDMLPDGSKIGVFYEAESPLEKFSDQLDTLGSSIRIVECESKIDIAKQFIRFDRKYGGTHKLDFALIAGHGTENSIMFGGYDQDHSLTVEDINPPSENNTLRKASKFFSQNPTIILSSCSTGKSDTGISQQLSEALGAEVIAPDSDAKLQMISVSRDSDNPGKNRFDAAYYPASTKRFRNGVRE